MDMRMRLARVLAPTILAGLASGCAQGPQMTPQERAELYSPVLCQSKQQCDFLWQRAQVWVNQNSAWRIQTANDVIIQTFGPGGDSPDTAYTIQREPNQDGSAAITISANCANFIGCIPEIPVAIRSFKQYLSQPK